MPKGIRLQHHVVIFFAKSSIRDILILPESTIPRLYFRRANVGRLAKAGPEVSNSLPE